MGANGWSEEAGWHSAELYVKSDVKLFELTSQQNKMTEKALTAHIRKIRWIVYIFMRA